MCLGLGQSQREFQANPNGEFHVDVFKVLPPSSNVSHSRVFRTDYSYVEKTLIPLIIKHWECAN